MKKLENKIVKITPIKKMLSVATALTLLASSIPLSDLSEEVAKRVSMIAHAVTPREETVPIYTLEEFVAYSQEYANNSELYSKDTIEFALSGNGSLNVFPAGYISLGTTDVPFNGKLVFSVSSSSYWFAMYNPLFTNVTDSVQIVKQNGDDFTLEIKRKKTVDPNSPNGIEEDNVRLSPLIAQKVTHSGAGGAEWKISSTSYDNGSNDKAYNFSGLLGVVGENADITIDYTNSSKTPSENANVVVSTITSDLAGANAGLIAGTLESNATVNLKVAGSNTGCNITSQNGNAGGYIGTMEQGSTLNIQSSSYTPAAERIVKASSGYAGGLVGECNGGSITFETGANMTVNGNVNGSNAAGGLFGSYSNPTDSPANFDISNYTINTTVISPKYAGGIFGEMNCTENIKVSGGSLTVAKSTIETTDAGGIFGGVCGLYKTDDLENEFEISNITINTSATAETDFYGGVIGRINEIPEEPEEGEEPAPDQSPAYVKVSGVTHTSTAGYASSSCFGGIVGSAGDEGSMLDIGTVTVSTSSTKFSNGGGIVGELNAGVLRLSGTTTMTNAPASAGSRNCGQLVGTRGDSLVYALGSGNEADTGWEFVRATNDTAADDIGSWGSVVRIANIEVDNSLSTGGAVIFDPSSTDHTVTVKSPVTTISTAMDFVKTALNMQLNSGDCGALEFADTDNDKTELLSSDTTLTFSGISLTDTGMTGLMRDDSLEDDEEFCGTITGGSSVQTLTLATGQRYGVYTTTQNTAEIGRGAICTHRYNGLLARTGTGASIDHISIEGTMNVNRQSDGTYIGGAVAEVTDGITLSDVNAKEKINFKGISANNTKIGGYIGIVSGDNSADITINGTAPIIKPEIKITDTYGTSHSIAGAIGYIGSKKPFVINVTNAQVSTQIDAGSATAADNVHTAGLIADIAANASSDTRTLNLTSVSVKGANISNTASKTSGGILGNNWYNTNVNFSALSFERDSVTTTNQETGESTTTYLNNTVSTNATELGGLVYRATGHWVVPSGGIVIKSLVDGRTSGNSFGMLINKGFRCADDDDSKDCVSAIYLDLTAVDSVTYNPVTSGDVTVISTTVYDEFCAYSAKDVLANASGIISITTSGTGTGNAFVPTMLMNGTACNTYQNKYNLSTAATKVNQYSRYYYNVDYIKSNLSNDNGGKSDAKKLLVWSLNQYAADNITNLFTGGAISGNCDMQYISYYPVDVDSVTIANNLTLKFYNSNIETAEAVASANGNTDSNARSTLAYSQHYLMHSALFRNATGTIATQGNVNFQGDFGSTGLYSGILINGTLSGSLNTAAAKDIVFEGITKSSPSGALFIHAITGANQTISINGVRTGGTGFEGATKSTETAYSATGVASSLIGDVTATNLNLKFNRIKLDGASSTSIFSDATLLNKLDVDLNTKAEYNFNEGEDWNASGTHINDVTYGKEITDSIEYCENSISKEKWYYDTRNLIYAAASDKTSGTNFSTGYLPYVKYYNSSVSGAPTPTNTLREVKVNVKEVNLTNGCGTYDHPYLIQDVSELYAVAKMIAGTSNIPQIRLPKTKATASTNYNSHWCDNNGTTCLLYSVPDDSTTYSATGGDNWGVTDVREYLASAYYQITTDLVISSSTFPGLGTYGSSGQFAFRGVITGVDGETKVKITNQTKSPLISFCTGAVVRNLDIEVAWPTNDPFVSYNVNSGNYTANYSLANDDCKAYGAVIGKIFAGDTIIENVDVTFTTGHPIELNSGSNVTDGTRKKRFVATSNVGGYIGTVIDGCVIFRGMTTKSATDMGMHVNSVLSTYAYTDVQADATRVNTDDTVSDAEKSGRRFLYVNPFIGRVINGFAFYETTAYRYSEDGYYGDGVVRTSNTANQVTLKNGRKNYSIADINKNSSVKLQFSGDNSVNVFAPDAQSLYIMSGVLLTTAGSASSADGNYNYAGAYKDNYNTTRHAQYSAIGTKNATEKIAVAKDTVNKNTAIPYIIEKYTLEVSGKYPARMLTGNNGGRKLNMYLCASNEDVNAEPAENAEETIYYMPDGFRGLGSFRDASLNYNLYLNCFDGRNHTVDMNAVYKSVRQDQDNYYTTEKKMGPGLFINLKQNGISSAQSARNKTIGNVTISGYISGEAISSLNGAYVEGTGQSYTVFVGGVVGYYSGDPLNIGNITFNNTHVFGSHHTGGIIGYFDINKALYINNFEAKGDRGLKVEAWSRAGGLIGALDKGALYINTLPGSSSEFKIASVENLGNNNNNNTAKETRQAGGLVGNIWADGQQIMIKNVHVVPKDSSSCIKCSDENYSKTNSSVGGIIGQVGKKGKVTIVNCSVKDMAITGYYAGGLIGINGVAEANAYAKVYDCNVDNCTITGYQYSGGILGYDNAPNSTYNVTDTKFVDPNNSSISYYHDFDGCLVSNCTITHTNAAATNGTGGIIGGYSLSSAKVRMICNTEVTDCTLSSPGTSDCTGGLIGYTKNTKLYGYNVAVNDLTFNQGDVAPSANSNYLKQAGNLIGSIDGGEVKLVGVTRQGTLVSKTTSQNGIDISKQANSPSVFVVYSDYDGDSVSLFDAANTWGTTAPNTGENTKDYSQIRAYAEGNKHVSSFNRTANDLFTSSTNCYPFVNVSPYTAIGENNSEFLNGDGAKVYSVTQGSGDNQVTRNYPLIKKITEDRTSSKRYDVPDVYTASSGDNARMVTALAQTDDNYNKISTYKTEMEKLPGSIDDFAIVVINSEVESLSTNIINNYIKAVTNTNIDYKTRSNSSNPYTLEIYSCTYDEANDKYIINDPTDSSLQKPGLRLDDSGNYFMTALGADTNQKHDQFSLIDVQFLNPTDASKNEVAMHVYIPVLTKKMMAYEFKSASLSGTDYKYIGGENSNYKYGNPLCESMNSWLTSYVTYTYSEDQLQDLVDNGIGLKWHNDKNLLLEYSETDLLTDRLNDSTQMVLIDPNKGSDEYYYATMGMLRAGETGDNEKQDTLKLNKFRTTLNEPVDPDESVSTLNPIDFRDLVLNQGAITVEVGSGTGFDYELADDQEDGTDGTVAYTLNGSTVYLKYKGKNTGTHKVTINKPVTESYYLSINVKDPSSSGKKIFNYKITSPLYIGGTVSAKRSNYDLSKITNILMGDLYTQDVWLDVKNNDTDLEKIDSNHHTLQITTTTRISMNGEQSEKEQLITHLGNPNISLLQTFIIDLTAWDSESGERKEILGKPSVSAEYSYLYSTDADKYDVSVEYLEKDAWTPRTINEFEGKYIQLDAHNIKGELRANGYTYLRACTTVDFENDQQQELEFPKRSGDETGIGVNVSVASNLSYTQEMLLYTNMTKEPASPDNKYFYLEDTNDASLTFNAIEGIDDLYDLDGLPERSKNTSQLGINPKNFVDVDTTRIPIYNSSSYDATKIKRSEFLSAKYVKYTLELYKKQEEQDPDDPTKTITSYSKVDDLSHYIDLTTSTVSIRSTGSSDLYSFNGTFDEVTNNGKVVQLNYLASIDTSKFITDNQQKIDADIDFTVITGSGFYEHANYRMVLKADLVDASEHSVSSYSLAHDWVVYTNAKINPSMVSPDEVPSTP